MICCVLNVSRETARHWGMLARQVSDSRNEVRRLACPLHFANHSQYPQSYPQRYPPVDHGRRNVTDADVG